MRASILITLFISLSISAQAQTTNLIETSDIQLFWNVYDKVIHTTDSIKAVQLIQDEYINKGSVGLAAIKNFTVFESKDLYKMIRTQQLYLNSIRQITRDIKSHHAGYSEIFDNFKKLYPPYTYPKVYFTIGNMLVGGFNRDDSSVVIGSELAVGTKSSRSGYLNAYLKLFVAGNFGVRFLLTHELVHTQQIHGYLQNMNLAGICIMEGSADFIADIILKRKNTMPYSQYGRTHYKKIRLSFIDDKLKNDQSILNKWIFNALLYVNGQINERPDLGYYIGYKICESYYNKSQNKNQAIREILQINYDDKNSVMEFYKNSGFE